MWRNPIILHVSDLHFGRSVNPFRRGPGASDDAKVALRAATLAIRPDFLVVTGDLSNGGRPDELAAVRDYLGDLLDKLWAEGQAARCIVIPGNHDVWRTTVASFHGYLGRRNRLAEFDEAFPERSFLSANVPTTHAVHITPKSLADYYERNGGRGGSPVARADAERMDRAARHFWEFFPSFQLAVLSLDSNVKVNRWKPDHIARGCVGMAQRNAAEKVMRDYDKATASDGVPFSDARRIALVHHHITRLPNVKLENWMLMDDAGEVARWLARIGVRLVLHGHYHRADSVGLTYWNTEADHSKVESIVLAAGSATAVNVDDGHNSCHAIALEHFRTRIRRPLLDNGEFQPLAAASSFEFEQKVDLTVDDSTTVDFPISTDVLRISMEGGEQYADHAHTYINVEVEAFIDKDRNYFASILLEGTNELGRPTTFVPVTFAAPGSQYFQDCCCQAIDLDSGKCLTLELMARRPLNLFPCRVYFDDPLQPKDSFRISVRFELSKVMLDENDYDMLNLVRFARGAARGRLCLLAEKSMIGPTLLEVRGGKILQSSARLQKIVKVPANGRKGAAATGYETIIESPTALCYLILYHKLV
jgi:3',5'-cyclic AMP phosphodiesterase CpdA